MNLQLLIRERLIVPYKELTQDKIETIIDYIRQYNDIVEQRTIIRGELGQYVVITASAHAHLLIEDTTLGAAVVEQIRDESTILQVWIKLYRETYGAEPVPLEISRFERYANNCMLISQISCGVCGIFQEADVPKEEDAIHEPRVLSSREVEQATIQIFMSSLVESGIPITNNVMQLIIYFTRHVLRATFDSSYGDIMKTIGDATDSDKPWYEQIQEIADSHTSWSSYPINVAENLCKNFTCEPSPGETELYYANYGIHVNLMGDAVLDMTIRNIMTNPERYIAYIKTRNEYDMSNPNINIAIRAIESLSRTRQTNLAELFAISNAFKLRLALFDSGCEYYQDQIHVKVLRCGKVVATEEQKVKSEKMPPSVKKMQPPPDSQREDDTRWEPELGGGNRHTKRRRRTTKKKPRRRPKRKTNRPKRKYKYRYTKRKHNNKRSTR